MQTFRLVLLMQTTVYFYYANIDNDNNIPYFISDNHA